MSRDVYIVVVGRIDGRFSRCVYCGLGSVKIASRDVYIVVVGVQMVGSICILWLLDV